jgi:hypothetical protein
MNSSDEATRLLAKNEDELLADLGADLLGLGGVPPSVEVLNTAARGWLSDNATKIRTCVCTEEVRKLLNSNVGSVEICVALGDLLLGQFVGVSPLSLAAIILKTGVSSFCRNLWDPMPTAPKKLEPEL